MLELNKIYLWDCLDLMKQIPDKSIDLVLTDPPYFWIVKDDRDNQRDNRDRFIEWLEMCTIEGKRILKDNWSLYIFWDDKVIAYVQVMIDKYFKLENSIVRNKWKWYITSKGWNIFRSYATVTERLLFYSNEVVKTGLQEISDNLELYKPIRDYFQEERKKTVLSYNEINTSCFWTASNWWWMASNILTSYKDWRSFPTKEKYEALQKIWICNKPYEELRKEYEELRKEYEELRKEYEELRRPFTPAVNYTDVREFNILTNTESKQADHPTQKPIDIIKRIIDTSSREWDIVLDCFMWSWTTAIACKQMNRNFIGIEREEKYVDIANKRLKYTQVWLF